MLRARFRALLVLGACFGPLGCLRLSRHLGFCTAIRMPPFCGWDERCKQQAGKERRQRVRDRASSLCS